MSNKTTYKKKDKSIEVSKLKITEDIYWVGYVDDRKVPFHRLTLENGTTYNSYLLETEKPTIIDTVDISFGKEYIDNLKRIIALEDIQYIVINHVEPDHSGGLPALASQAKDVTIVCTEKAVNKLKNMYRLHDRNFMVIKDGDKLDIGGKTLKFFETPYLHTEETMISYAIEDKILFPCDIFSSHVATSELFNDLADTDIKPDFEVYYKLIMHPHRPYVQNMIDKIKSLDIKMIAPSHGYIIRENVQEFIDTYDLLSRPNDQNKKALIIYSTMSGNTRKIAKELRSGLEKENIKVKSLNVSHGFDMKEIKKMVEGSDAIFFGSSTRYADLVGNLEDVLQNLKEVDLGGKLAVAFGSYGWSGEAVEIIQDYLNETNMKVIDSSYIIKSTGMDNYNFPIRVKFQPEEEKKEKIRDSARVVADLLVS
ncbi:MAG: FprA family A-type flavoprotein [Halanaerobiales bacterium]